MEDDDWRRRLELRAATAAADTDAIAARLSGLLDVSEFGEYGYVEEGESRRYAKRVETAVAMVDELVASGHADDAVAVAEYAIDVASTGYRYAIDPAGAIFAAAADLIASHHAACVADLAEAGDQRDPGLAGFLARRMLSGDDFPPIAVESYLDMLGPDGVARLRDLLTSAQERAPANWSAQRAVEKLLRALGDVDALVDVLSASLPDTGLGHIEIANELLAVGREDEALAWAERGLRTREKPPQAIADFVVERYLAAGRPTDALTVRRDVFAATRDLESYERLRDTAEITGAGGGPGTGAWTATRDWALGLLRGDAEAARSGRPGLRCTAGPVLVDVLISEGDIAAAWDAAAGVASDTQWLKLADLAASTRPAEALAVYLRQIQPLKQETGEAAYERMARLLASARDCHARLGTLTSFDMYLRALRADQKRKAKLIRILDRSSGALSGSPTYPPTSPNRPSRQSATAVAISCGVRATKFHHISSGSPSGTPPSNSRMVSAGAAIGISKCPVGR